MLLSGGCAALCHDVLCSLDGVLYGWDDQWMGYSMDGTLHGWESHWIESSIVGKLTGWDTQWREWSMDGKLHGWDAHCSGFLICALLIEWTHSILQCSLPPLPQAPLHKHS